MEYHGSSTPGFASSSVPPPPDPPSFAYAFPDAIDNGSGVVWAAGAGLVTNGTRITAGPNSGLAFQGDVTLLDPALDALDQSVIYQGVYPASGQTTLDFQVSNFPSGDWLISVYVAQYNSPPIQLRSFSITANGGPATLVDLGGTNAAQVVTIPVSVVDVGGGTGLLQIIATPFDDLPIISAFLISPNVDNPPDKPTISATALNFHEIQLLMSPASDDEGVISRTVWRDGVQIDSIVPDTTIYVDSQLAADTLYSYLIKDTDTATNEVESDAAAARTESTYRIDSGQTVDYDESTGYKWFADTAITGATLQGTVTAAPISGTADPLLYQSVAVEASAGGGFSYSFPLEAGQWRAVYHFAEYDQGVIAGDRRFTINIDGSNLYSLDVYAEAGLEAAHSKDFIFTSDGQFDTTLTGIAGNAFIAALEILPVLDQPGGLAESGVTPSAFQVDCGDVSGASQYAWYLDTEFAGYTVTSFKTFGGLLPSTVYDVTVEAIDVFGYAGPISATLQVSTNAAAVDIEYQLARIDDLSEYLRLLPYGADPDLAGVLPLQSFVSFRNRDNLTRFGVVAETSDGSKVQEDITKYDSWECKLYAPTDLATPLYTLDSATDLSYFDLTDPDAVGVYFGKYTGQIPAGIYRITLAGIITATAPQGKQVLDSPKLEHREG